jgi:hypothetical protein
MNTAAALAQETEPGPHLALAKRFGNKFFVAAAGWEFSS